MTTEDLIARAEKALEGTSPGPWRYTTCYGAAFIEGQDGHSVASAVDYLTPNNADLICEARTLVPELIAALRKLTQGERLADGTYRPSRLEELESDREERDYWEQQAVEARAERDALKDQLMSLARLVIPGEAKT